MGSDDPCLLPATDQARALRDGSLGAVELAEATLARIERIEPGRERDRHARRRPRARGCERRRPPARLRPAAAAAARPADRAQGPGRHGRRAHHLRLAVVPRFRPRRGRAAGRAPARGRRDHGRQDQHAGVGRGLAHVQSGIRRHPQSVGSRALGGRVERRRRGRPGLPDGAACRRQRPGRVAAKPGRLERHRRPAADAGRRPGLAVPHPVAAVLGRRADGPHGRRRGAAPGRDGRARPAGAALAARRSARSGRAARRRPARPPGRLEPVARRPAGGAGGARAW